MVTRPILPSAVTEVVSSHRAKKVWRISRVLLALAATLMMLSTQSQALADWCSRC